MRANLWSVFLPVFVPVADLVDESCAYDTCWKGDKAYSDNCHNGAYDLSRSGYRCDITVPQRRQCRNCPPESREDIFELIRLCRILDIIHKEGRNKEKQQ